MPLLYELLGLLLWYPAALVLLYWLLERPRLFDRRLAAEPTTIEGFGSPGLMPWLLTAPRL